MTIHTHDSLDHEEAKVLTIIQVAARHATPDVYRVTLETAAKRFAGIDVERRKLLQGAK